MYLNETRGKDVALFLRGAESLCAMNGGSVRVVEFENRWG